MKIVCNCDNIDFVLNFFKVIMSENLCINTNMDIILNISFKIGDRTYSLYNKEDLSELKLPTISEIQAADINNICFVETCIIDTFSSLINDNSKTSEIFSPAVQTKNCLEMKNKIATDNTTKNQNSYVKKQDSPVINQNKSAKNASRRVENKHPFDRIFYIENFYEDCIKKNHHCVFGVVKKEALYELFYRSNIYSRARDNAFRKSLSEQDGELVAYCYITSIDSLREILSSMNIKLRHNGNIYINKSQLIDLIDTFHSILFL